MSSLQEIKKMEIHVDELLSKINDFQSLDVKTFYKKYINNVNEVSINLDELLQKNIDFITQNLEDYTYTGFSNGNGEYIKNYLYLVFSYENCYITIKYNDKDFFEAITTLEVTPLNSDKVLINKKLVTSEIYLFLNKVFTIKEK